MSFQAEFVEATKKKTTQFKKEKRGIVGSEVDSLRKEKVAILTGIPCTSILSPSNFMHNVRENRQLKRRGKKKKAIVVAGCAKRLSRPLLRHSFGLFMQKKKQDE